MELWRGAAGVIPGLARVASHSWCYLFRVGDFLRKWLSFPAATCWNFPAGPVILSTFWCSSADSVMHPGVGRGVPNTIGNIQKLSDFFVVFCFTIICYVISCLL